MQDSDISPILSLSFFFALVPPLGTVGYTEGTSGTIKIGTQPGTRDMQTKIVKRTIDQLQPRQSIADNEVKGFRARCLPSGVITYEFRYRNRQGQRKFINLGRHGSITADEARVLAKKRAGEVADDRDPATERATERAVSTNTVNAVLDNFVDRYARKQRSAATIESAFDRLVRPSIGTRPIYDLTRSDMTELLDAIEDGNGAVMADRTLAYLRKAFNWQMTRDEKFISPIIKGMARTKPRERQRDRVLDDQEIRDLWNALDQLAPTDAPACYPDFIRALLLSGQRRTNVSDWNTDENTGGNWVIPAERMKGKRAHLVPITDALAAFIVGRRGFVFSSDGGKTPFSGYSKAKTALDRKIAELRKAHGRKPMPHWTLHDLRRTARSIMSRYTSPDIAERVIGHVIPGVRGVYDLYQYADEKRAALEKLGTHIEGVVRAAAIKSSRGKGTLAARSDVGG